MNTTWYWMLLSLSLFVNLHVTMGMPRGNMNREDPKTQLLSLTGKLRTVAGELQECMLLRETLNQADKQMARVSRRDVEAAMKDVETGNDRNLARTQRGITSVIDLLRRLLERHKAHLKECQEFM